MIRVLKTDTETARFLAETHLRKADWECRSFGAGKFSQTYSVHNRDTGERYVLRIAPPDSMLQLFYEYRMMRQEPAIHRRLAEETTVPAPPIVAHDFSRTLIDRDYLIMPRLPGTPLSEAGLTGRQYDRALREWGGYVAQIHGIRDPDNRFGYLGEHRCMEPQSSWPSAFREMYSRELQDTVQCGVYDEQTAIWVLELLDRNLSVFESCRAPHLLHGDIWVTNLLVEPDGRVTGVLDFDRACWGDIEWDLAIADYCGVTRPAFWEGYGREVRRDIGEAAVRRFFYLLYEHQKYIVISMSERRSSPERARSYASHSLALLRRFERTGQPVF
jgi:aminoglycoside phosphotransferase (APT) family kinase protein